jgi:uncharacterized membrane protein YhaH (DUF805 family)/glutaredoxin
MTQQYRVVLSGRTLSGGALADIKVNVGREFRLQGEQLDRMLSGKPVVVARSATAEAAEKLASRLRSVDLQASIEPLPVAVAPTPVAAPPERPPELPPVSPAAPLPPSALAATSDELFALSAPRPVAETSAAPAGGQDEVVPAAVAGGEVVCPKCGAAQPKRTLCRQCGLDMPRFLAAQAAADAQAREERAAELAARRSTPGSARPASGAAQAAVIGIGFAGRLGRLDYFAGSLVSSALWLVFVVLAVYVGKPAFVGFGLFLSVIYSLRCIALRLHDTGRTGWLALVALVPLLGALMALVLLFIGGDADENDHGMVPVGGGARVLMALLALAVLSGLTFRGIGQNPEMAGRFLQAMRVGQGDAVAAEADEDAAEPEAPVNYARNNRIDIYVIAGCTDCERMRAWLDGNRLSYTLYAVDSDNGAAERLHSIIAGDGQARINLPVLEVNGKVLPGNPDIGEVHRLLRQEAGQ